MHKDKEILAEMILKFGWFKISLWLSEIADNHNDDILQREFENIAVNYVPEVR